MCEPKIPPWESAGDRFKNEVEFWTWVRGFIREGWSRHPVKLEYVKQNRFKVPNPNPGGRNAEVWGMECRMCKGHYITHMPKKTRDKIKAKHGVEIICIEINHKTAGGSLRNRDDFGVWAGRMLYVGMEDLEPLCKPCHDIESYSQKWGLTIEEARLEKKVIKFANSPIDKQKQWLSKYGPGKPTNNATARKDSWREVLKERAEHGSTGV